MTEPNADSASLTTLPPDLAEAFAARSTRVTVSKGKIIIGHTDNASDAFLIESGTAQVSLLAPDGKEAIFRDIGAGEMFGEMSAIDGAPRSASVLAKSQMTLLKMNAHSFAEWLDETNGAGVWLARLLVSRMRGMTEKMFELATMSVTRRIHTELLRIVEMNGDHAAHDTGPILIERFPTHSEFAARIGTHREAISRELGWLRENEIVETQGRTLTVIDPIRLRSMAKG